MFSKIVTASRKSKEWAIAPLMLSRNMLQWGQTHDPNLFVASTVLSHTGNDIHVRHAPLIWKIDILDPCITVFPPEGLLSTTRMSTLRFEYDTRKGGCACHSKGLSSNIVIWSTPIRREWKDNNQELHDRLYTYASEDPAHIWQIVNQHNPVLDQISIDYSTPEQSSHAVAPSAPTASARPSYPTQSTLDAPPAYES